MSDPEIPARVVKTALNDLRVAMDLMDNALAQQKSEISDLRQRAEDAEQRAMLYERRADDYQAKAKRTEELEGACEKLIAALDRLPMKMEDAGIVQTITPPEIPLYGTYDWEAVTDAKFALKYVMKRT